MPHYRVNRAFRSHLVVHALLVDQLQEQRLVLRAPLARRLRLAGIIKAVVVLVRVLLAVFERLDARVAPPQLAQRVVRQLVRLLSRERGEELLLLYSSTHALRETRQRFLGVASLQRRMNGYLQRVTLLIAARLSVAHARRFGHRFLLLRVGWSWLRLISALLAILHGRLKTRELLIRNKDSRYHDESVVEIETRTTPLASRF